MVRRARNESMGAAPLSPRRIDRRNIERPLCVERRVPRTRLCGMAPAAATCERWPARSQTHRGLVSARRLHLQLRPGDSAHCGCPVFELGAAFGCTSASLVERRRRHDRKISSCWGGSCGSQRPQHFARCRAARQSHRLRSRAVARAGQLALAESAALAALAFEDRARAAARADYTAGLGCTHGRLPGFPVAVRRLYSLLISCAAPCAFAVVLWRGLRDRSYWH